MNILTQLYANFFGWKTKRKLVVIESDDWGAIRMPNKDSQNKIKSLGFNVDDDPYLKYDSIESPNDLYAIVDILSRYFDSNGKNPKITLNYILTNPKLQEILKDGIYYYEYFYESYLRFNKTNETFNLVKEGVQNKYFQPQYHGREHLNILQLKELISKAVKKEISALEIGVYGLNFNSIKNKRSNLMATFDYQDKAEIQNITKSFCEGIEIFKNTFGFSPKTFISPCYIWSNEIENVAYKQGVIGIQGNPIQKIPSNLNQYKRKKHFTGERNQNNLIYSVRNAYFEPSINKNFNSYKIIKRAELIFSIGKPLVISCHRLNFMGSLSENNRRDNLKDFNILIKSLLKRWPEIEFISSDELFDIIANEK